MIKYYRQRNIKTKRDIKCYWCNCEISQGEIYVGVAEKIDDKSQYRRECPECNKMILELGKTGEYGYNSFYVGINKELIREYLKETRCKKCKNYEDHKDGEGFLINCKRREIIDEA